jgi:hypothetical protein
MREDDGEGMDPRFREDDAQEIHRSCPRSVIPA